MKVSVPRFSYLITFVLALMLSGCALFNREVDNIEVSASPNIVDQRVLTKMWTINVGSDNNRYSLLGPATYEQNIYLASRSGEIKAVSRDTGKVIWQSDLSRGSFFNHEPALLSGGVSVDASHVYVGSEKAIVYALNRETGALVWKKNVAGEVLAKPVSSGNRLLINTSNGYLQALNNKTGALLWQSNLDIPPLSLRGQSVPVIAKNVAIVGDNNGHVNSISLKDGLLIWQQRISQPTGSTEIARLVDVNITPVVVGNTIYAIGYNGNMVALDLSTGQTIWHRNIGSTHNFIVTTKYIYLVDQNDILKAINRSDGSLIWQNDQLKNRRLTDPVPYEGYLVVGDSEGYLYVLDTDKGNFVNKTFISRSGLLSTPIVADKKLIIQARNGTAQAYMLLKG